MGVGISLLLVPFVIKFTSKCIFDKQSHVSISYIPTTGLLTWTAPTSTCAARVPPSTTCSRTRVVTPSSCRCGTRIRTPPTRRCGAGICAPSSGSSVRAGAAPASACAIDFWLTAPASCSWTAESVRLCYAWITTRHWVDFRLCFEPENEVG